MTLKGSRKKWGQDSAGKECHRYPPSCGARRQHLRHPTDAGRMRSRLTREGRVICLLLGLTCISITQAAPVLRLEQSIGLPGVNGRLDHLAVDLSTARLFICALKNNSVELVDLRKGAPVGSITGLRNPQGVAYATEPNRLYVANAKGGACNIYDGNSLASLGQLNLKDDADNVRYDSRAKRIYVGYGDGAIATIDAITGAQLGTVKLPAHPESFHLEQHGSRIFANVPSAGCISVIDRTKGDVIAQWKTGLALANFPMALDEPNRRLFIGCRSPATLLVLDTESGKIVAKTGIGGDADDIFYDGKRRSLYVICGTGEIDVIGQEDRDRYKATEKIPTAPGARTGLFIPELNSLLVAVPNESKRRAEIRRYTLH
jgi:DNA-binding beta-propeller fold protein YncE